MKRKKKKIVILLCVLVVLIAVIGGYFLLRDENRLSSSERLWITENANVVQNVYVLNDANLFGNLGNGVYYSFLNDFSEEYSLQFNPITVTGSESPDGLSLTVTNALLDLDVPFYEDHYVLVSKKNEVSIGLEDLASQKIGVLSTFNDVVKNYLGGSGALTLYSSSDELFNALDSGNVSYVIVPRMENMDTILEKNLWIVHHFSDLKRYFVLRDSNDSVLFRIMRKYFAKWSEDALETELYAQELALFQGALNVTDAMVDEMRKTTVTYGFMTNLPYEVYGDGEFGGILSEYVGAFAKFLNLDIEYKRYSNERRMLRDMNNGNISLYFNYNTTFTAGSIVDINLPLSYAIYAHESNPIVISSLTTLGDTPLYVEENSLLYQNLASINGLNLVTYKKDEFSKVLKDENNLVVMDDQVGEYLRRSSLKKYHSRYIAELNVNYSLKSTGSETFNLLLAKYMNYIDQGTFIEKGIYSASVTESKGSFLSSLAKYALYSVILIILILLLIYRSSKRIRMQKKIRKEDKLKFIDQLTSLKNRNYLNESLSSWNKNTIYPQCVVMIDLNRVQEINDTLGYEEGDRQIKGAANSLIKTQLDNTDIIRTNGNEFIIYMVGYNQKQITSYIHKLNKDFKNLPYDYGACITYSMIDSDLKSVEDAINECVDDIKKQKGKDAR